MGEITDKTEALSAVKADSWELENVSDELKADKEVVMVAVKNNGDVFKMKKNFLEIRENMFTLKSSISKKFRKIALNTISKNSTIKSFLMNFGLKSQS